MMKITIESDVALDNRALTELQGLLAKFVGDPVNVIKWEQETGEYTPINQKVVFSNDFS